MNNGKLPVVVEMFQKYYREVQQEIPEGGSLVWSQSAMLIVVANLQATAMKADLSLAAGLDELRGKLETMKKSYPNG